MSKYLTYEEGQLQEKFLCHPNTADNLRHKSINALLVDMKIENPDRIQDLAVALLDGSIKREGEIELYETIRKIRTLKNRSVFRNTSWRIQHSTKEHGPYGQGVVSGRIGEYQTLGLLDAQGNVPIGKFFDLLEEKLSVGASQDKMEDIENINDHMSVTSKPLSNKDLYALGYMPLSSFPEEISGVEFTMLKGFGVFGAISQRRNGRSVTLQDIVSENYMFNNEKWQLGKEESIKPLSAERMYKLLKSRLMDP